MNHLESGDDIRRLTTKVVQNKKFGEIDVRGGQRSKTRKNIVLCFDGTGNRFHGDSSDSNILKIFRMLDRSSGSGFHYYQPGIGSYVSTESLGPAGSIQKIKNAYKKAKDSAVGTSFDEHVVGGYKFLMQFYSPGDNIYMFGFSRGAYTARFLAEMLDWVGLITHGNEAMIQFAWRTFSKWKSIQGDGKQAKEKQKKAYDFMVAFRETFSRPVKRIRFLGLFDTVNSVPRFENAMMSRHRIPFSAISSAKIVRHAVSIDERRAKFRSDLVPANSHIRHVRDDHPLHEPHPYNRQNVQKKKAEKADAGKESKIRSKSVQLEIGRGRDMEDERFKKRESRYRGHSRARSHASIRSTNASASVVDSHLPRQSIDDRSVANRPSITFDENDDSSSDEDEDDQDIEELWFPGGHADIGGGWNVSDGETPLSHVPLVWIVREARKTGLAFDENKMRTLNCLEDVKGEHGNVPTIEMPLSSTDPEKNGEDAVDNSGNSERKEKSFEELCMHAATTGMLHDCLEFKQGLAVGAVLWWNFMEWIPFRRMDLKNDGKWIPIRWPLPRGEVRDMPDDAKIHHSAIKRMQHVPTYRPGNLILGGGGRGVKFAPKEAGIGEWEIIAEEGDVIGERVIRKRRLDEKEHRNGVETGGS